MAKKLKTWGVWLKFAICELLPGREVSFFLCPGWMQPKRTHKIWGNQTPRGGPPPHLPLCLQLNAHGLVGRWGVMLELRDTRRRGSLLIYYLTGEPGHTYVICGSHQEGVKDSSLPRGNMRGTARGVKIIREEHRTLIGIVSASCMMESTHNRASGCDIITIGTALIWFIIPSGGWSQKKIVEGNDKFFSWGRGDMLHKC